MPAKRIFVSVLFLFLVFLSDGNAKIEQFPFTLQGAYRYVTRHTPPFIDQVGTVPENPLAGMPTKVTALLRVTIERSFWDPEPVLYYAKDGENPWVSVKMEESVDAETDGVYEAEIPAMEAGTVVRYRIFVEDDDGDKAFEVEKKQFNWPLDSYSPLEEIIASPEESDIKDDMDITGVDFGYDDAYLYFRMRVRGRFTAGYFASIDNAYIHGYVLGILAGKPYGFAYVPHAVQAGYPEVAIAYQKKGKLNMDTDNFNYAHESHGMSVRIPISVFREMPAPQPYRLVFVTGAVYSIKPFSGSLEDGTTFAHVYLREHEFKVSDQSQTPSL